LLYFASLLILREKQKDVTGISSRLVMKFSYLIIISFTYGIKHRIVKLLDKFIIWKKSLNV